MARFHFPRVFSAFASLYWDNTSIRAIKYNAWAITIHNKMIITCIIGLTVDDVLFWCICRDVTRVGLLLPVNRIDYSLYDNVLYSYRTGLHESPWFCEVLKKGKKENNITQKKWVLQMLYRKHPCWKTLILYWVNQEESTTDHIKFLTLSRKLLKKLKNLAPAITNIFQISIVTGTTCWEIITLVISTWKV